MGEPDCESIQANEADRIQFALNLELLKAEFFLNGAVGQGLNTIDPSLAQRGPPRIGTEKANLDPVVDHIIKEFGFQAVDNIRAIKAIVGGFPRPPMDLSSQNFAKIFRKSSWIPSDPPFDPYLNSISYLLASYLIPHVGLLNFVGNSLNVTSSMRVGVSLLDAEITADIPVIGGAIDAMISETHGECAVIRTLLYEKANKKVLPYNMTVAEFTEHISKLRNTLSKRGTYDEGIIVPISPRAYNQGNTNIILVNHTGTLPEILRILQGTGSRHIPGGFSLEVEVEILPSAFLTKLN